MSELIQQLNEQFGIPGIVEVVSDRGGLPAIWIEGKGDGATGTVYLHGAHVAAWRPAGFDEVLWLSGKSAWEAQKPVRGGVPVCFPWFGGKKDDPKAPPHGFARLRAWSPESIRKTAEGVTVTLSLKSDDQTRAIWPHDFHLRHRITFGNHLTMALEVVNTGQMPFTAEEALHTYFCVGDVRKVRVTGLDKTQYLDKADGLKEKAQQGDITITGETDRVYLDTAAAAAIEDPTRRRRIRIAKENSHTTVVWNPWIAKAKAMPDFGDDEWTGMICVETCSAGKGAITVAPGQTHTMAAHISVESL